MSDTRHASLDPLALRRIRSALAARPDDHERRRARELARLCRLSGFEGRERFVPRRARGA